MDDWQNFQLFIVANGYRHWNPKILPHKQYIRPIHTVNIQLTDINMGQIWKSANDEGIKS